MSPEPRSALWISTRPTKGNNWPLMLGAEDHPTNSHAFCVFTLLASLAYYQMACSSMFTTVLSLQRLRQKKDDFLFLEFKPSHICTGLAISELCFAPWNFLPRRGILHLYFVICHCTALSGLCRHLSINTPLWWGTQHHRNHVTVGCFFSMCWYPDLYYLNSSWSLAECFVRDIFLGDMSLSAQEYWELVMIREDWRPRHWCGLLCATTAKPGWGLCCLPNLLLWACYSILWLHILLPNKAGWHAYITFICLDTSWQLFFGSIHVSAVVSAYRTHTNQPRKK